MTLRRFATTSLVATALAFGAVSMPNLASVSAAPAAVSTRSALAARATVSAYTVHSVVLAERGDDPLVGLAIKGLDAWMAYRLTDDGKSLQQFNVTRDALARKAAARLGIVPARMVSAWRSADLAHQLVLVTAFTQLGTPYHAYQSRPGHGFDCSGFTSWVWGRAGVNLARISRSQIRAASARTADTAQAGDLAYYPGHVMLYLGVDDAIVHSPRTGEDVTVAFIGKHHTRSTSYGDPLG